HTIFSRDWSSDVCSSDLFSSRRLVKDPPRYFYTGIGIYILSACIWSERFFIERFHTTAPSYLAFPGSTYLYIIVVAALTYGLTEIGRASCRERVLITIDS